MEEEIIVIEDATEEEIIVMEEAIEKVYPELQDKIVTPTTEEQKIKADSGIYGLNEVTINAVNNEIDENIKAENIKSGISILGIEGNVVELVGEEITIQPKSYEQEITPTSPSNGFSKIKVEAQSGVDINDYFETNYTGGNYLNFIKKVPNNILIKGTSCNSMFANFQTISEIQHLDTSKVIDMYYMFSNCSSLTTIPQLDTSKVTNMYDMFYNCSSLITIPQLDTSKVTNIQQMFNYNSKLTDMGGLKNLGMAYLTTQSANYYQYTLNLSFSPLTHDSLMNVINNLYDIASKGCKTQSLILGSTNIAKLTAEEIAIATNKGFNVS